jgi:hypothetical protein
MTEQQTPAGWYDDGSGKSRWWDGQAWTDQIQEAASTTPTPIVPQEQPDDESGKPSKTGRPDIDSAVSKMTTKLGSGREIKKLPEHLWEGEKVEWLAGGTYGGGQGLLALTDRRLFFLKDGVMKQVSEDFPLEKISSIQWSSGMLTGKVLVFVSGNKSEIINVSKAEGKAIVDSVRGYISGGGVQPEQSREIAAAAAAPRDEMIEQLKQLAGLRDAGILTEEEFTAKKAQILGI